MTRRSGSTAVGEKRSWAARLTSAATSPAAKNIALAFGIVLGAGITCTILVLTGNADGGVAHA